ncbi:formyltetrahydrofolate deformylase [Pullulanibacillus sp. KACC 23026]|uniref:formyltetrahydrofolate deformylase n=1 Tax=Pullulanibacillus sp. KACC 23026 TaxID=3028315 RepID=UPI0023AEDC44|nr:formyltetrahydrofolate deformylase [Pullulanibacillus sp. KACC 23026]WEG10807.1 formyltetrahydrofolate deformylase [Pullulanibacillus sp. KACC 23026]
MNPSVANQLNQYRDERKKQARLLISCPDQTGIVAAISHFLNEQGCNIIESSQYSTNPTGGLFFIRLVFEILEPQVTISTLKNGFQPIADNFAMKWDLRGVSDLKKIAILVSKELHCLQELLWEWESGHLKTEIKLVISNHQDAKELVESYGIPFFWIPSNKENRSEAEREQQNLFKKYQVDTIVLTRYMQILTPDFVSAYPNQIINIHHSFLPAFIGAKPYERAFHRGVKLIGATSHYVTNDLDEGPIIEQDIMRVDHRDTITDLKKIGQSVERSVLARAVKWHLEDRIIIHENKTIVFN